MILLLKKRASICQSNYTKRLYMHMLYTLFGEGKDLGPFQMVARAIISFFLTLVMIRVAGIRTFGKRTAFDNVIVIMLGSVFSRVVVGASPFLGTTLACFAFVLIHRLLAWICVYNDTIGRWVKGEAMPVFYDGVMDKDRMSSAHISEKDLQESVREQLHQEGFENVGSIVRERNGDLSVIRK